MIWQFLALSIKCCSKVFNGKIDQQKQVWKLWIVLSDPLKIILQLDFKYQKFPSMLRSINQGKITNYADWRNTEFACAKLCPTDRDREKGRDNNYKHKD